MGFQEVSALGPKVAPAVLFLAAGWAPLFLAARMLRVRLRPARLGLGAALAAFAGGMCCVELRRYGLLALPVHATLLPGNGLALHEVCRFGFLGAAGALACDAFLDRLATDMGDAARISGKKED
jgi:hypothetical protein